MAANCSTGFRSKILDAFAPVFDGGSISIYSGAQPTAADDAVAGLLLGQITAPGGLQFTRTGVYVHNDPSQTWTLTGEAVGVAGWGRLLAPGTDTGGVSLERARIDFAIGPTNTPGDFQLLLPSLDITPLTEVTITAWWFLFPPI